MRLLPLLCLLACDQAAHAPFSEIGRSCTTSPCVVGLACVTGRCAMEQPQAGCPVELWPSVVVDVSTGAYHVYCARMCDTGSRVSCDFGMACAPTTLGICK